MDCSQLSFATNSDSQELSASWIRQSTIQSAENEAPTSSDMAIAELALMGLWMGRNCREITNNTDAIFRLDMQIDSGGSKGQGYSASIIDANNTMMVNNVSKNGAFIVRKHIRSWGLEGRDTAMDFLREIRVLTHKPIRKHRNIISLLSFEWMFWPGNEPSLSPQLCLERSELGDLASFQRVNTLTYDEKRCIFLDITRGLIALHDSGIVHGDVKSENILIFKQGDSYEAKICDFGFAVFIADIKEDRARLLGGTIPWTAPEFRRELPFPGHFLKLTDVYSLGLLFWRVLLDGKNPFEHALLKDITNAEQAKIEMPPLVNFSQASTILRPDYAHFMHEIWGLLACTIQKNPLNRKIRTVLRILSGDNDPISQIFPQLSSNPAIFAERFNIRNISTPVRLHMMKHLRNSALQLKCQPEDSTDNSCPYPVALGAIDVALGDGGLYVDDDPAEALKLITTLADMQYVPMQAIIVRIYDYFDEPWPLELQQKANDYLGNGVINGSVTAALDYESYWPNLEFQTQSDPNGFFLTNRAFYGNGTGLHLSERAVDIGDTHQLYENILTFGADSPLLRTLYGLNRGNTLLHACAMLGMTDAAEMLISEFSFDVNGRNDMGDTPLLAACRHGRFPMAFKLIAKDARPDIANINGETPLHWALNIPHESFSHLGQIVSKLYVITASLHYAGGNLEARAGGWASRADVFTSLYWVAGTPLHRAVSRRNFEAARVLVSIGANPEALNGEDRISPLDLAMLHHNAPMLQLLLSHCKFNANRHYPTGHSIYSRALSAVSILEMITIHGKEYPKAVPDTLDVLISYGFDITRAKTETSGGHIYELDALYVAAFYERLAWVQYFLSSPKCMEILDINKRQGEHSMTALHQAIHTHRKSIFVALLDAGADPSLTCSTWSIEQTGIDMATTSLHLVAQQGDPDLFFTNRLLEYDLDIDAEDFYGITPFACAVIEGHLHIANALLKRGADINKRTTVKGGSPEHGKTVLSRILSRDCGLIVNRLKYLISDPEEVAPALTRSGPAAEFMVEESRSAPHVFLDVHRGREDESFRICLEILLSAFSQPEKLNYRDEKQRTPLHLAALYGNAAAVFALVSAGAMVDVLDEDGQIPADLVGSSGCGKEKARWILDRLHAACDSRELRKDGWELSGDQDFIQKDQGLPIRIST